MSHMHYRVPYKEEGSYGGDISRNLLIHQNNGCDTTTVFDDTGNCLFSYSDTVRGNLLDALVKFASMTAEDISHCSPEEIKLIR